MLCTTVKYAPDSSGCCAQAGSDNGYKRTCHAPADSACNTPADNLFTKIHTAIFCFSGIPSILRFPSAFFIRIFIIRAIRTSALTGTNHHIDFVPR